MVEGRMRRTCVWVGLIAAALGVLATAPSALAAFPGSNGKIAYHDGTPKVSRINPDGTNAEVVKTSARNPVWSSDGTRIAYVTPAGEIRITAADGSGSTLVCTCIDG